MNITFKDFAKQYKWLFIIAIVFPIISILNYFIAFSNEYIGKEIWATIMCCIISYVGTIAWGVFIFYHSWLKEKDIEKRETPRISIDNLFDKYKLKNENWHQCFFTYERLKECSNDIKMCEFKSGDGLHSDNDDYGYLGIGLNNLGSHLIHDIMFTKIYVANRLSANRNDVEITEQKERVMLFPNDNHRTLAFKDRATYFVGVLKRLVDTRKPMRREVYIIISFTDEFSKDYTYISNIIYNNGTIIYGSWKGLSNKEIDAIQKNPKSVISHF